MSILPTDNDIQMQLFDLLAALNPWWAAPSHRGSQPPFQRRRAFAALRRSLEHVGVPRATALVGPRQVGKTTLLRQLVDEFLDSGLPPGNVTYFDFKDDRLVPSAELRDVVEYVPPEAQASRPRILLLDEVTGASRWAPALKLLVDAARQDPEGAKIRLIVTDSAAGLLREGAWESLQGRVDEVKVESLDFGEFLLLQGAEGESSADVLRRVPNALERYLSLGGFPEFIRDQDPSRARRLLRSDARDKAIGRDLLRAGVDIARLRDLFTCLVQDSGAVFDAASRARELAASEDGRADPRSIRAWLMLLERASLVALLNPRDGGGRDARVPGSRALKSRPKVYAGDHGYVSAFAPYADPMAVSDVRARIFEAVVFLHLRAVDSEAGASRLSYYRQREDLDLDFVVEGAQGGLGIDVTSSARVTRERLDKKWRAAAAAGLERLLLIHAGREERQEGRIRTVPLQSFLLDPQSYLGEWSS
jgi:predicted AAA+ superfamily ATPase